MPDSRLIVARTAFKNNTSVYSINGRKSNFTEVTTLLKGRGIDLDHKRFLILQGEVESIAQMAPKGKTEHEEGLLEYLEDIIGTSQFKAPIEEAALKVDECNEQRSVKLERLKFVQREKQSLEVGTALASPSLRVALLIETILLNYPTEQEEGRRSLPARPERTDAASVCAVAGLHDGMPQADGRRVIRY